ncbi:MAG: DUF4148 domain-containing protein [Pseudomonadota bacterium]|nr:DUF4148 domain-containing protein [Burkholderiaceae bacterium]MDQ3446666.1 DUF4148 domain-containing protein [Pseudomonadota bacterium]
MRTAYLLIATIVFGAVTPAAFAGGGAYPVPAVPESAAFTKSRAQVKAELREAARLGLLSFGEGDVPVATPAQEQLIADAGRHAEKVLVAKKSSEAAKN